MKRKRISHMLQLVAVCLSAIMLFGTVSMAGNVSDAKWGIDEFGGNYYYTSNGKSHTEMLRLKEDDTYTYFYMNDGSLSQINFIVMGKNLDGTQENCTGGPNSPKHNHTAYKNAVYANRYFTNSVYEFGYTHCYLLTYSYYNGTATGWWSPDSV